MSQEYVEGSSGFRSKFLAAISYLGILCLVPLVLNGRDQFVSFHARQGLVLWIWGVLAIFSLHLPVIGGLFFSMSALLIMVFSFIGLVSVLMEKAWRFPVIGNWAMSL
ncbi:MAG: hypothetical protein HQK87_02845 [Nitrospinae bacterium]|nr:hypothetical protein [Nitrospinota bacterium]